jgi:uncharacterized protein with ATP-grasp and redox domains
MVRQSTDDVWLQWKALDEALAQLASIEKDTTPSELAYEILKPTMKTLGVTDPYADQKKEFTNEAKAFAPQLEEIMNKAKDKIRTALALAAAGNALDSTLYSGRTIKDIVDNALDNGFAVDDSEDFINELANARNILYILDNAGELYFDRVLLEELRGRELTCVVRKEPILSDATHDDAVEAGIDKLAKIIDPGVDTIGIPLQLCSHEFKDVFKAADMVIAKGQAAYETLDDTEKDACYFLLMAKCDSVAKSLGVNAEDIVIVKSS